MRILIITMAIILTTFQSNGQNTKKKKSKNVDTRDAQIDSLTMVTKALTLKLDSIYGELSKYAVVTDSLKVPGDTALVPLVSAPTSMAKTDSVPVPKSLAKTDSVSVPTSLAKTDSVPVAAKTVLAPAPILVEPKKSATPDSVAILRQENKMLTATADSIKVAWMKTLEILSSEEVVKATAVNDLKILKGLLDSGIITIAEFTVLKKKYLEKL